MLLAKTSRIRWSTMLFHSLNQYRFLPSALFNFSILSRTTAEKLPRLSSGTATGSRRSISSAKVQKGGVKMWGNPMHVTMGK